MTERRKLKVWGCLVCKSLKNRTSDTKCPTCGAKRETERFAFSQDDALYLCLVNTARAFPQVTISRLSHPEVTKTVNLPTIQESLLDAVKEAVTSAFSASGMSGNGFPKANEAVAEKYSTDMSSSVIKSERLDLYDSVMNKAKDLEYDVILGQFVPAVAQKELKYVQSMKKEKETMIKIVQDTILCREDNAPHTKDLNVNEDILNEWKEKVPCSLCHFLYPPAQLLGSISNQSILNWMKEHEVSTDTKECKKMLLQAYEAAKMCLFCTQFFDENYADTFDVEISANEEIRSRRKEDKIKVSTITKDDQAIEKMNEKLAIAELKSKKDASRIRLREPTDDAVVNAERVIKLQEEERRLLKFKEAKEKFRRHKANLVKKAARTQSASNTKLANEALPSLTSSNKTTRHTKKSKGGSVTSRSDGAEEKIRRLPNSENDAKFIKAGRIKDKRLQQVVKKKSLLPSVRRDREKKLTNAEGIADSEPPIVQDCIDMVLNSTEITTDSQAPKKKKIMRQKKIIVNRMTKKEIARLELLKEIAEKKEKEDRRYKSRKLIREKDWSSVRVGDGGQEQDMQVIRYQEKRAALLIEEYERDMSHQQQVVPAKHISVVNGPEAVIDRPVWDATVAHKHQSSHIRPLVRFTAAMGEESDAESDDDIMEADNKESSIPTLKPTITLEMLQQHKQHLKALHLKHLEAHIDSKNLEDGSAPPTADGRTRVSITKDMLQNHKKHVLASKNEITTIIDKRFQPSVSEPITAEETSELIDVTSKDQLSGETSNTSVISTTDCAPQLSKFAKKSNLPTRRVVQKKKGKHVKSSDADLKKKFVSQHHDEDIDYNDGFDSIGSCSSLEYANDDFEPCSVMDDEDVETPMIIDDEQGLSKAKKKNYVDNVEEISVLKVRNFGDSSVDENYEGFDSFMDSLQKKETTLKHSPIATISTTTGTGGNISTASRNSLITMKEPPITFTEVSVVEENDDNEYNDVSFDEEDDTHLEIYSATVRYSPVTVNRENVTEIIENGKLPGNDLVSTPSGRSLRSSGSCRGMDSLRSGSRGQLLSPGGSRRGSRVARKSSRLEQYDNGRPTSRNLRPLSRSNMCSGGSVRKSAHTSHLEQYDNVSSNAQVTDLNSSGNLSNSGIFSPPSSAIRRKKKSEGVTKLQVVDGENVMDTPSAKHANMSRNSSRSGMKRIKSLEVVSQGATGTPNSRRRSVGSRSGKVKASNTLEVLSCGSESIHSPNFRKIKDEILPGASISDNVVIKLDEGYDAISDSRKNSLQDHGQMIEPIGEVEEIEEVDEEDCIQNKDTSISSYRNKSPLLNAAGSMGEGVDRVAPLPTLRKQPTASHTTEQYDNTPSMLDMKFNKFKGGDQKAAMKRMDSFDKLSKRIKQTQAMSPNVVLEAVSPTKLSTYKVKDRRRSSVTVGAGGATRRFSTIK